MLVLKLSNWYQYWYQYQLDSCAEAQSLSDDDLIRT